MIPLLAWIANNAPRRLKATYFAVMASFANLALSGSSLATKYLNMFFVVEREVHDPVSGATIIPRRLQPDRIAAHLFRDDLRRAALWRSLSSYKPRRCARSNERKGCAGSINVRSQTGRPTILSTPPARRFLI